MTSVLAPTIAATHTPRPARPRLLVGTLTLARANALYWTTVAPCVHAQLARWERRARELEDARRRALALGKLRAERFNAQLAATLATLAPRAHRRDATEAIVALQVAYDYIDALTEQSDIHAQESERLAHELLYAVGLNTGSHGEDPYLHELAEAIGNGLSKLPAASEAAPVAARAAKRCAQAQTLAHEAARGDEEKLESWAREQTDGGALGWREWLAGAQASVLCLHALIAAAAEPGLTREQARELDELYMEIGALTMLDSLIDRDEDLAAGQPGYLHRYDDDPELMAERLGAVAHEAAELAGTLPHARHHLMTLAGVVAFYGSAPAARDPSTRVVFEHVGAQLRPLTGPTMAVMRTWRLAKRVTSRHGSGRDRGERT